MWKKFQCDSLRCAVVNGHFHFRLTTISKFSFWWVHHSVRPTIACILIIKNYSLFLLCCFPPWRLWYILFETFGLALHDFPIILLQFHKEEQSFWMALSIWLFQLRFDYNKLLLGTLYQTELYHRKFVVYRFNPTILSIYIVCGWTEGLGQRNVERHWFLPQLLIYRTHVIDELWLVNLNQRTWIHNICTHFYTL